MKKQVFVFAAIFAAVSLLTINVADAQWRSETHDVYNAPSGLDVTIDGNLDEWGGVMESVTGTDGSQFCGVEFEGVGGAVKVFEEHGGGKWNSADDQTVCFMIAWNPDAAYLALSVTDDEHQNSGAAWNGDAAQLAFEPTGKRTGGLALFLYNVALDNNAEKLILHNERTNGQPGLEAERDFAITRDESAKKTYYEFKFTPANFGLDIELSEGIEIGLGICVNDGDKAAGQGGQKGWGGWYPHSVVHGKNSEKTGLVVLSSTAVTAVEPADKLTTTWGTLKSER
ncbi:MAG: hypothetical protein OXU23_03965 [Candidatus Poribacteria bacterium]|nr:hypothetical protein [Candidatus Poribacteria bacterium]